MPEDLGTWSGPQAEVLVKVLRRAGCSPTTSAAPGGNDVVVTVPDDEAERANRAIAADMDTIARAAREERERNVKSLEVARRNRERRERTSATQPGERPLGTERLRRFTPFLGMLLAALLVAGFVPPAARFPAILLAVLVVTYLIGRGRTGDGAGGRRPAA